MTIRRKYGVALAALAVVGCISTWFAYAPEHWMTHSDVGMVKVDDKRVYADIYIGNPTQSEAEAIALIHVPGVGDYFFDFGGEVYREAPSRELIRLPWGAWTFKSMREGRFQTPLYRGPNEFRVASSGHIVAVQF